MHRVTKCRLKKKLRDNVPFEEQLKQASETSKRLSLVLKQRTKLEDLEGNKYNYEVCTALGEMKVHLELLERLFKTALVERAYNIHLKKLKQQYNELTAHI